jgi:membrane-bound ClpP family serine protease
MTQRALPIYAIYAITVWALVPSFFWIRGLWRNDWKDRLAALIINGVLVITIGTTMNSCGALNAAGVWFFAAGVLTLVLSAFRRVRRWERSIAAGTAMTVAGRFLMSLL